MSKENNEQTQGVPAGPYTVEKHGDGFAIYTGRTPFHRGMNWGQLTECSEALATAVERGLNMLSAAPQAQPVEAEQATVVMQEPAAVVVTWRVPGGTETGVEWMDAPPPDGTKLYVSAQPVREPLTVQQERDKVDAERYRWIKENADLGIRRNQVTVLSMALDSLPNHMGDLDEAIDYTRKE